MSAQSRLAALITAQGASFKALVARLDFLRADTVLADAAIAGINTENIIGQMTVPANTLVTGSVIKVTLFFEHTSSVNDVTPRVRIGTAGSTADLLVGNAGGDQIRPIGSMGSMVQFYCTVQAAGAASTAKIISNMMAISGNSSVAVGQRVPPPTKITTTFATNVTNIITVSLAQAIAVGITANQCIIEVIP